MTFRIINPDALGRPSGWNHGMLTPAGGRILFVAGQTAPERAGLVEQWAGALERVLEVVRAAGGGAGAGPAGAPRAAAGEARGAGRPAPRAPGAAGGGRARAGGCWRSCARPGVGPSRSADSPSISRTGRRISRA